METKIKLSELEIINQTTYIKKAFNVSNFIIGSKIAQKQAQCYIHPNIFQI